MQHIIDDNDDDDGNQIAHWKFKFSIELNQASLKEARRTPKHFRNCKHIASVKTPKSNQKVDARAGQ